MGLLACKTDKQDACLTPYKWDFWPAKPTSKMLVLRLANGAFGLQNRQARCLAYALQMGLLACKTDKQDACLTPIQK